MILTPSILRRDAQIEFATLDRGDQPCASTCQTSDTSKFVRPGNLGIVSSLRMAQTNDGLHTTSSFGRVVDELAKYCDRITICAPILHASPSPEEDHRIAASNVGVVPTPVYTSTMNSLRHSFGIANAYRKLCRQCDFVLVRGFCPMIGALYGSAWWRRREVCHWIVGDPIALLKSHKRAGSLVNTASLLYARLDRSVIRVGRWLTSGAFICNGQAAASAYVSPRTITTVSSAIRECEVFPREDTCLGNSIRFVFVGYARPEKGIENLLDAMSQIRLTRPWSLEIIGPTDRFDAYEASLHTSIDQLGIADRVHWTGYVPFGAPLFEKLRQADVFVFPSLSEGTPRVLVEARANGVPIIATNVGGIPTSVTDGVDGLLVAPKDAAALASAITRVVFDGALRRGLIRNGLEFARKTTVEHFAALVMRVFSHGE